MSKQKDKKIVFSEEIDSSINGIALGTAFVMLDKRRIRPRGSR